MDTAIGGYLPRNALIHCVQVSSWDSIFGPMVEQISVVQDTVTDPALHRHVARMTLESEIYRVDAEADMEIKFLVVPSFDMVMTSIVFSAAPRGPSNKFSIALLSADTHLPVALRLQRVIDDRLVTIATQLQLMLNRIPDRALPVFNDMLIQFVASLDALSAVSLPKPNLAHSVFACNMYPVSSSLAHGDQTSSHMRPALNVLSLPAETVAAANALSHRQFASQPANRSPALPSLPAAQLLALVGSSPRTASVDLTQPRSATSSPRMRSNSKLSSTPGSPVLVARTLPTLTETAADRGIIAPACSTYPVISPAVGSQTASMERSASMTAPTISSGSAATIFSNIVRPLSTATGSAPTAPALESVRSSSHLHQFTMHRSWNSAQDLGLEIDPQFLSLCVSSHLQTMSNSVVIGHDASFVNMFVETLSFFLSDQQRQRARYACTAAPSVSAYDTCAELSLNYFMPDMALQGILIPASYSNPDEFVRAICSDLIQSCEPSTVIYLRDFCSGSVHQCLPLPQFNLQRRQFCEAWFEHVLNAQLQGPAPVSAPSSQPSSAVGSPAVSRPSSIKVSGLANAVFQLDSSTGLASNNSTNQFPPQSKLLPPTNSLSGRFDRLEVTGFDPRSRNHRMPDELAKVWKLHEMLVKPVTQAASGIVTMISDNFRLPLHLREVHLITSFRSLLHQASVLAAFVDARLGGRFRFSAVAVSPTPASNPGELMQIRRELCQALAIDAETELLLTSLAEQHHPGLFVALFGDPTAVNQKVIQMFNEF